MSELLLLSKNPQDKKLADATSKVLGWKLVEIVAPIDLVRHLQRQVEGVILIDSIDEPGFRDVEKAIEETIGLFSSQVHPNQFLFLGDGDPAEVPHVLQSALFGGYVMRAGDLDGTVAAKRFAALCAGLIRPKAVGPLGFLSKGAKSQTVRLARSTQKQEAVEAVRKYLESLKFQSRISNFIANAVDELLMNAIFDAPADEFGKQIYAKTARTTEMALQGKQAVEMILSHDADTIAVTAVDLYGSLDKNRLLTHVAKKYVEEEYRVKSTTAGAGLGLGTIFHIGASFCFVCEKGARTEATVFFEKSQNFKEFRKQFRFLVTQFYSE